MKTLYQVKVLSDIEVPIEFLEQLEKALKTEFEVGHFNEVDGGFKDATFNLTLNDKPERSLPNYTPHLDYVKNEINKLNK